MPTYVVNIHLKGITPISRHPALDALMGSLGFLPFRPGVPPEARTNTVPSRNGSTQRTLRLRRINSLPCLRRGSSLKSGARLK
jgi:hypothetical protein